MSMFVATSCALLAFSTSPLVARHSIARHSVELRMQEDEYDLSRTSFDLLEGRSFRRDALLQYGVSQRSQQLRIIFFASSAPVAAGLPFIVKELIPGAADFDLLGLAGSAATALFFGLLAVNEKNSRGKVLLRLERELASAELSITQPNGGGGSQPRLIGSLRNKKRIVAVRGSASALLAEVRRARVYRRRLAQSGVALVCVRDEAAGSNDDAAYETAARAAEAEGWLWNPSNARQWREYFGELLSGKGAAAAAAAADAAWFALSLKGRSCASAVGPIAWDELLGTKLPPLVALSPTEPAAMSSDAEKAVLAAQRELYDALTSVDVARVGALCLPADDPEVSALAEGGRLDGWSTVLKYDATVGLRTSSQDATVDADGLTAYTTALEFPAGGGGGGGGGRPARMAMEDRSTS